MRGLPDYHVHTFRCGHAGGSSREFVQRALDLGLSEIAFTDHIPLYFWLPRPGIRSWRCAKTSSTAISRRSGRSATISPGGFRCGSGSRPTTPKGTRTNSRAGSPAPTGTSCWARCTGSREAGSTIRGPRLPVSIGREPRFSTTSTTASSRRRRRPGSSTCSRTSTCRRSTGIGRPSRGPMPRNGRWRPPGRRVARSRSRRRACARSRRSLPRGALLSRAVALGIPVTFSSDAHASAEVGWGYDRTLAHARAAGVEEFVTFEKRRKIRRPLPPGEPAAEVGEDVAEGRRRRVNVA